MNLDLDEQLALCSAHRKSREKIRDFVLKRPEIFPALLTMAFDVNYKYHFKACWIVELVADAQLEWLQNHLDFYCNGLPYLKDESGIRPIAKVAMILVNAHFRKKTENIILSESQLEKLAEVCFDWLISNTKVASKAYAIRTLYALGKKFDWIYPELKIILEKDYQSHSAAYKAVAREILKKVN